MTSVLAQIVRDRLNGRYGELGAEAASGDQYHLERNFSTLTATLRDQFEKRLLAAIEVNDGLTPLLFAYCPGRYQTLTASAERIVSAEVLDEFLNAMRIWGGATVGASCVSTPQLRVYIKGCCRELLVDDVEAQWHWILALGGNRKLGNRIRLSVDSVSSAPSEAPVTVDRIVSFQLEFNQLLVHNSACAYGIEEARSASNPLEAAAFLEGYLW